MDVYGLLYDQTVTDELKRVRVCILDDEVDDSVGGRGGGDGGGYHVTLSFTHLCVCESVNIPVSRIA